jgi:DNA-binding HxlR family transcriptional regulator
MAASDFDYREIDDVVHGRVRLAVMAYLVGADAADFNELKSKVGGTDGNLSAHLRKLEEAGYVRVDKTFAGRKPRTICRLTGKGREAFIAYVSRLQSLLAARGD